MEVSISEFQENLYKYIKQRQDIVVTKRGKKVFVVTFCSDNQDNVVTNPTNVVTKQDVIATLRKAQEEIISKPISPVKIQWCEACIKIRQRVPAVEKCEIINGDGMIEERWLCDTHKGKVCSS